MKRLLCYLVVCGIVCLGRGLFIPAKTSDSILSDQPGANDPQQLLKAYHEAALRVVPYSEQQAQIDLAFSLVKLEPKIDRENGCEHLWDVLRISRRFPLQTRHFIYGRALFNMSLCVSEPTESRSWLSLAEQEAFWAKQFKTSSPELAQKRNDLYETILRREHLMDGDSQKRLSSQAGYHAKAKGA